MRPSSVVSEAEFLEAFGTDCYGAGIFMGCQQLDHDAAWQTHEPAHTWTEEELRRFEIEKLVAEQELESMAEWWGIEGVRCATFGPRRDSVPKRKRRKC